MSAATVRVLRVELAASDCVSRLPFRFGRSTVTWAPMLTARVTAEVDGEVARGYSADLAMPRWFDKDRNRTITEDVIALASSASDAGRAFEESGAGSVFELWRGAYGTCHARSRVALVTGFGLALIERGLMDAACRAAGLSFFDALREDLFGFRPGVVHPELDDWDLVGGLREAPLESVRVRHTIGLLDPLRARDVDPLHRADDGLPEALEEDVARFGLDAFKVKLGGDPDADARRLGELAEFLPAVAGEGLLVTLDANEQLVDRRALERLLDAVPARLTKHLAYVEQPFPRDAATMTRVDGLPVDVILDEGDGAIGDFERALAAGYRGVSVKNCKGVFRTLLNRGLCEGRPGTFQAAEDLTNLPVVPLQQDLATVASLGLPHVERNGHHYFRGLAHLPPPEARAALAAHPGLYEERDGDVYLRIEGGRLDLRSLSGPGYGACSGIDFEARTPLSEWTPRPATSEVR